MNATQESVRTTPLRLWPGVAGAVVVVFARLVVAPFTGDGVAGLLMSLGAAAAVLLWWLLLSRAAWWERLAVLLLIPLAALLTMFLVHPSIGAGPAGGMLTVFLLPATVPPFLVLGAALSRRAAPARRVATIGAAIFLGSAVWVLARTDGMKGEAGTQLAWRWSATAEEELLASTRDGAPSAQPATAAEKSATASVARDATDAGSKPATSPTDHGSRPAGAGTPPTGAPVVAPIVWSGFRGERRDSVADGVRINQDWNAMPPAQMWRRKVGPGWSSFAVAGDLLFTQEQRGEHEVVSAYRLASGEPVWRHQDAARFYESQAAPGRAAHRSSTTAVSTPPARRAS